MALEGGEVVSYVSWPPLHPGRSRYPLYKRSGGSWSRSGQAQKILFPPGFIPWTIQPVACHYTMVTWLPTILV